MIQSQVNLDHRLAELRQVGIELRLEKAARESGSQARTLGSVIRSLVGGAPASGRPTGLAAA